MTLDQTVIQIQSAPFYVDGLEDRTYGEMVCADVIRRIVGQFWSFEHPARYAEIWLDGFITGTVNGMDYEQ
mgnify:FL=1